jgi:hypothetical protein
MSSESDKLYPSMCGAGVVEVELPCVPGGPWPTEKVHARAVPRLIIDRVERSFNPNFAYLRGEGAPPAIFGHYSGVLQGLELVDKPTGRTLNKLVTDFGNTDKRDQQKFWEERIRPFISEMKSTKR